MRKLTTNHFPDFSCREVSRLFYSPHSIWHHAGGEFLAFADPLNHRHLQPSRATTTERQRSVLEKLIAVVAPAEASDLASNLIAEFGSIGRAMDESLDSLQRVIGDKPEIINLLRNAHDAMVEGLLFEVPHQMLETTDQRLLDYLVATMGCRSQEILRVMFLDRGNRLVADEVIASGSVNALTVYPRNIFKRAFELSASAILVVHNHPGGSIEPSKADIDFTKKLAGLGSQLEIEIIDHIIIAGAKWFSFLRRGLL